MDVKGREKICAFLGRVSMYSHRYRFLNTLENICTPEEGAVIVIAPQRASIPLNA
jgi:hypothetical protein